MGHNDYYLMSWSEGEQRTQGERERGNDWHWTMKKARVEEGAKLTCFSCAKSNLITGLA